VRDLRSARFCRYYADKREVLFGGSKPLQNELLRALGEVPPVLPTIEAVRLAIEALCVLMRGRRDYARERNKLVIAHDDLQERDLIKRAVMTGALAEALLRRGVSEPEAHLAADMGIAVFYDGFARWIEDPTGRELVEIVHEGFAQLKAVAAGKNVTSESSGITQSELSRGLQKVDSKTSRPLTNRKRR
jgi:hypothetical protein